MPAAWPPSAQRKPAGCCACSPLPQVVRWLEKRSVSRSSEFSYHVFHERNRSLLKFAICSNPGLRPFPGRHTDGATTHGENQIRIGRLFGSWQSREPRCLCKQTLDCLTEAPGHQRHLRELPPENRGIPADDLKPILPNVGP